MSNAKKKTLAEHLLAFEKALTDDSDVYAGNSLQGGKGLEKARKGREKLAGGDDSTPLVVIDSTVWGSVAEGFYITEDFVYAKELYEDKHSFRIRDIHTIYVDESQKSIVINGIAIKWLGDSITPKAKIVARCIREYLESRTQVEDSIQEGLGSYIGKLKKQLGDLHSDICGWNLVISRKTNEVLIDNTNHMPMGDENFIERMSIAASRSKALKVYDLLRREAGIKIENLRESVPVKHANEKCREFCFETIEIKFDFGDGPDRDTSISNDDWQSRTDDALYKLQDCPGYLMDQLEKIMDQLTRIQKEECDDD